MTIHHSKRKSSSPSQIFPSAPDEVASGVTLEGTYVVLCDWHGQVVWKSAPGDQLRIGDDLWKNGTKQSTEDVRAAVAKVASLREQCMIEVENTMEEHFRLWMWPLLDAETAICVLAMRIPAELSLLTDRERGCLGCLAQGKTTREIAEELEIGLTTVHTHLRRSREKLGLTSAEALIGFAARYFSLPTAQCMAEAAPARKRSG